MQREFEFSLDVRYYETDAQGVVHHANYLKYLELARVEQLRAAGHDYAEIERQGFLLVVSSVTARFHRPSRFGDTLRIRLRIDRARGARVLHSYKVYRGDELVAEASSVVACVDRAGKVCKLPDYLRLDD